MARMEPLRERSQVPEYALEAYDYVAGSRGSVPGPSGVLLRAPAIGRSFSDICDVLQNGDTSIPKAQIELAICVSARAANESGIWGSHSKKAVSLGISQEAMDAVENNADLTGIDKDEAAIIKFGRELLVDQAVTDDTYQVAVDRFGERGVVELTAAMGAYLMAACVLRAAGIVPTDGRPALKKLK